MTETKQLNIFECSEGLLKCYKCGEYGESRCSIDHDKGWIT